MQVKSNKGTCRIDTRPCLYFRNISCRRDIKRAPVPSRKLRKLPRPTLRLPSCCQDLLHDTIQQHSICQDFCAHGLPTFPKLQRNGTRVNTSRRWHRNLRNMRCTASWWKLAWTTKSTVSESERRHGSGSQSTKLTIQTKQPTQYTTRAIASPRREQWQKRGSTSERMRKLGDGKRVANGMVVGGPSILLPTPY